MFFRFIIGFVVFATAWDVMDAHWAGTYLAQAHKAYTAEMLK